MPILLWKHRQEQAKPLPIHFRLQAETKTKRKDQNVKTNNKFITEITDKNISSQNNI